MADITEITRALEARAPELRDGAQELEHEAPAAAARGDGVEQPCRAAAVSGAVAIARRVVRVGELYA